MKKRVYFILCAIGVVLSCGQNQTYLPPPGSPGATGSAQTTPDPAPTVTPDDISQASQSADPSAMARPHSTTGS